MVLVNSTRFTSDAMLFGGEVETIDMVLDETGLTNDVVMLFGVEDTSEVISRVLNISGSVRRRQLRGFHPLSLIAVLFDSLRANDLFHTRLTRGKMSIFCNSLSNPIRVR